MSTTESHIDEVTESEEKPEPSVDSSEGRYPINCLTLYYKQFEVPADASSNRKKLQKSLDQIQEQL